MAQLIVLEQVPSRCIHLLGVCAKNYSRYSFDDTLLRMRHILAQERKWFAVLDIPPALWPYFQRQCFKQALYTEDAAEAQKRAIPIIDAWETQIAEATAKFASTESPVAWRPGVRTKRYGRRAPLAPQYYLMDDDREFAAEDH